MTTTRDVGERLVRALATAVQTANLYPERHPECREAITEVVVALRAMHDAVDDPGPLYLVRRAFYLGPELLPAVSLELPGLLAVCDDAGIRAIEFAPTANERDVATLLRILREQAPITTTMVGIEVNHVEPTFALREAGLLTAVQQAYGLGEQAVDRAGAAVAGGEAADLEQADRAVRALADEVTRDPGRAMLLAAIRSQDDDARRRAVDVAILSMALGRAVGLEGRQVTDLGTAALLHDVGMLAIPSEVVDHPGPLTEEQWERVRRHPVIGAGMLLAAEGGLAHIAASVALEHHVGVDGSGYPCLPSGRRPSSSARIVAVADGYVALTSARSYRMAEERRKALATIAADAGGRFDERVVEALIRLLGAYPIGSFVRLGTGEVGVVVSSDPSFPARPTLRLLLDAHGEPCEPREVHVAEWDGVGFVHEIVGTVDPSEVEVDLERIVVAGAPSGDEAG